MPYISLDTLFWRPGWKESPADEFRTSVRAALDQDPRGWVVDGMFFGFLGNMVPDEATDVICEQPCPLISAIQLVLTAGRIALQLALCI